MGRQIGHHHHAKIKESDNLPYRDWLGQTEGGTGELAIGLMMTFCLPVISSHNPRHLQEPVVGDQLSLKRDFPFHIYLYLAKACCSSVGGEHPSGASDCQDRPHPDSVSSW